MPIRNERGYTLPELIVVMAIFVVVMLITTGGFNTAIRQVSQQTKGIETQIGNLVGLELMRSDLQNAGYGLPWDFSVTPPAAKYTEITDSDSGQPVSAPFWIGGSSPKSFNDASTGVPRAVQSGDTSFNQVGGVGSKYLVIKSLTVAPGATAKKWTTVTYGDGGRNPITTFGTPDRDLAATEKVMVLRNTFVDGIPSRKLQVVGGKYSTTFGQVAGFGGYTTLMQPHSSGDVFEVYGVSGDSGVSELRMPFNRADYYVRTPDQIPPSCAPHTGTLYKAVASQVAGGGFSEIPLLDCVADMQVVYGLSMPGTEVINNHQITPPGTGSAKDLRELLKEIRVYILAHEGRKDPNFNFPSTTIDVGENFGGLKGRTFDLSGVVGPDYKRYRWKVYTIVVRPKNLIQ